MVPPQPGQLCCKRAMALAPVPAEIVAAHIRALLEQAHPDDHGFLPSEFVFGVSSTAKLDNSQLVRYKKMIAYNGTCLLYCLRRTNHVDGTKGYWVRRGRRAVASGAHRRRRTDDASRS